MDEQQHEHGWILQEQPAGFMLSRSSIIHAVARQQYLSSSAVVNG
jgi:hypothetical protein